MRGRFSFQSALLATSAFACLAPSAPAFAQELPAAKPDTPQEDIVVTGSRVKGDTPVGSALITVGRSDIDLSNTTTTSQLFLDMPQVNNLGVSENNRSGNGASANFNFSQGLNVHGVGPYATLILVDGQRVAPQGVYGLAVDTSIVPAIALERLELVPDGASAIYGSDAIAGVANLILRRNFKGVETTSNYGFGDNYREYQAGVIAGTSWGSGHGTLTYNYDGHSALKASDRSFARSNLTGEGGTDFRATQCNPGNIVIGGVSYAIPSGGVTPATTGSLKPGTSNRCDNAASSYLIPHIRQQNVVATFDQHVTGGLSVSATGLFSRRQAETRGLISATTLTIPTTNAFYVRPAGAAPGPETVRYSFGDFPASAESYGTSDFYQGTLGAKLKLPHNWEANASFTYGGSTEHYYQTNNVVTGALNAALASSNPATAFNPYGGANSSAVLAGIGNGLFAPHGEEDQDVSDIALNGSLFDLPGGDVRLAVGYQHMRARQHSFSVGGTDVAPAVTTAVDFTRRVNSGYAELLVPIIGPDNAFTGVQSFQIDAAGRYDDYSDVGSTTNPKVGFTWEVVNGFKLHGSYGTSFRAPPVYQARGIANSIVVSLPDPQAGGRTKPATAQATATGSRLRGRKLEQQQLDCQQHRGDRRAEDGGHAGDRARDQQRLAFSTAQMKVLGDQRAERAAGHDDRSFRAERAAAADGDRRRQRLEHGDLGRHLALAEQNGFDRLRYAVAANRLAAVAGDQADDETADDG